MPAKLVVLYPHPREPEAFERQYVEEHLPLMREIVGPDTPLPTYKTVSGPKRSAAYYRVAEIHFPSMEALTRFIQRSERLEEGRRSSNALSTGGTPIVLMCERQPEI